MSDVPSIIGSCQAIRDTTRRIDTITVTADVFGTSRFLDVTPPEAGTDGFQTSVSVSGSFNNTWYRQPLSRINPGSSRPGPDIGRFNAYVFGCGCCPCRVVFAFDGQPIAEIPGDEINGAISASMPVALVVSPDPPPPEPPDVPDVLLAAIFWLSEAAPCKVAGGPFLPFAPPLKMQTYVTLPNLYGFHEYFDPADPDNPLSQVVSGTNGAGPDSGSPDDLTLVASFYEPTPCMDEASYSLQVSNTNTFTDAFGFMQSVDITTTFLLVIGSIGVDAGLNGGHNLGQGEFGVSSLSTGGLTTSGLVSQPLNTSGLVTGSITTGTLDVGVLQVGGLSSGDLGSASLTSGGLSSGGLD